MNEVKTDGVSVVNTVQGSTKDTIYAGLREVLAICEKWGGDSMDITFRLYNGGKVKAEIKFTYLEEGAEE